MKTSILTIAIASLISTAAFATQQSSSVEGLIGSAAVSGSVTGVNVSSSSSAGHGHHHHSTGSEAYAEVNSGGIAEAATTVTISGDTAASESGAGHLSSTNGFTETSGNSDASATGLNLTGAAAGNLGGFQIVAPRHHNDD